MLCCHFYQDTRIDRFALRIPANSLSNATIMLPPGRRLTRLRCFNLFLGVVCSHCAWISLSPYPLRYLPLLGKIVQEAQLIGTRGRVKKCGALLPTQRISLGRERRKNRWSKLQNFDIVMVYMRNKLMRPTLSSCLPAGQSSSFSFQEVGIAAT